jgi:hypothetical protein
VTGVPTRLFAQAAADATGGASRLDRNNLLIYRDAEGRIQPVQSPADWQKRRDLVLQEMQHVMGPLPGAEKRCPLDVHIEEEVDCGHDFPDDMRQIAYRLFDAVLRTPP